LLPASYFICMKIKKYKQDEKNISINLLRIRFVFFSGANI